MKARFIQEVKIQKGQTVLQASKDLDIRIKAPCGGKVKCGKCLVKVIGGQVSKPDKAEKELLGKRKLGKGWRLACAVIFEGDTKILLK